MENIMVSVCCITYNHEKYIRNTLEGFVSQKTNFNYEVLIHDDASTDNTQKIIKEYSNKYPDIIKPILQTENQWSKGCSIQRMYNYPRARGKYIAYCEGDDYWCDSSKLQRQFDALESHTGCALCVHQTRHIDKAGNVLAGWFPGMSLKSGRISAPDYIHLELVEKQWLFQTSSYFIRKEVINRYMDYIPGYPCGDLPLVLFSLQYGDCWYIPQQMSCYRKNSGGAMSKIGSSEDVNIKYYQKMISGHKKFNEYTKKKYDADFNYAIKFAEIQILKSQGNFRKIMAPQYRDVFKTLNVKNKMLIWLGSAMPRLGFKIYLFFRKRNV